MKDMNNMMDRIETYTDTIIGKAADHITLEGGSDPFGSRFRCGNCRGGAAGSRKLPLHCKVIAGEPKINCNNDKCNCPCRTHYACKSCGHLHPYEKKCNIVQVARPEPSKEMIEAIELVNTFAEEQREKAAKSIIKKGDELI
ncbi:MAG: hypothetical protein OXC46_00895 [Thaumarchaeota archaeon]|nr:hypothetical protein [Nitrososphaerota archaeon]